MNSNPITTSVEAEQAFQASRQLARIPLRRIGRAQGLPSGQVHHLVQDNQGIFWFATPGGLACYDGSSIRTFSIKDGLSTQGLRALAVTPDGRVWVGSDTGLDIVEPDGSIHPFAPDWAYGLVEHIAVGEKGRVWLGTVFGLLMYEPGNDNLLRADDFRLANSFVSELEFDNAGRLWVAGGQFGLLNRDNDRWRSPQNWGWTKAGSVQTIAPGPDDTLFVGGENGIVQIRTDGSLIRSFLPEKPLGPVTALLWADNLLWAGIGSQFMRFKAEQNDLRILDLVLPDNIVNFLREDNHGNIWAASDTSGALKISSFRHAISRPRLDSLGAVFSLREMGEGKYLIGGERGAARLNLRKPDRAQPIEGLRNLKVWDILETATGQVWAATQQGLHTFIGNDAPRRIGTDHSVLSAPARVLHERGNSVWIGTLRGLARTVAGDAVEVLTDRGESLGYVYSIMEDSGGALWVGTLGNGLWFETSSGFSHVLEGGISASGNVYGLTQHADGRIAFLQDGKIFLRQRSGEIKLLLESSDSLAGWSIKFGPDNTLYVGSAGGLRLYDAKSGELKREIASWMGVSGWEFTTSRSLALSAPGLMLCGLNSGLAIVDLREYDKFTVAPTVRLRKQVWNNAKVVQDNQQATVEYGKWTVEFSLFTGWFLDEEDVRVRVRLLGFDAAWSAPMSISTVQYNSLPVGKYTLEAQAYSPLTGWG
ncbi:MAG: two-component regulator propeller domain-containing protein, partial [Burkholderiales bacterium]